MKQNDPVIAMTKKCPDEWDPSETCGSCGLLIDDCQCHDYEDEDKFYLDLDNQEDEE